MKKVAIADVKDYNLENVKKALSEMFEELGMPEDNPLKDIVTPGDTVFIKPNWVASRWRESCDHRDDLYCVITHPSVIEAVADYVADALQGEGRIIIGDNPSIDADFSELMGHTGIRERMAGKYDCEFEIKDLRPLICDNLANYGKKDLMVPQSGDDQGMTEVNLGKESLLYGLDPERFRGVFDEREDTVASHTGETQLYTYANSIFNSDVFISIPKLKTHQKVGATLNLKGLVGTISLKNQLVHWQVGYPDIKGDEYPDKESYEEGQRAKVKHRGSWPGNDTIWRMVGDLYKGIKSKERKYFTVIDGIIAGEGQGPFCPESKRANTLIAADDFFAADCVAARYMGLDPMKIRYLKYFLEQEYDGINLESIEVVKDGRILEDFFTKKSRYLDFKVMHRWEEVKYSIG